MLLLLDIFYSFQFRTTTTTTKTDKFVFFLSFKCAAFIKLNFPSISHFIFQFNSFFAFRSLYFNLIFSSSSFNNNFNLISSDPINLSPSNYCHIPLNLLLPLFFHFEVVSNVYSSSKVKNNRSMFYFFFFFLFHSIIYYYFFIVFIFKAMKNKTSTN